MARIKLGLWGFKQKKFVLCGVLGTLAGVWVLLSQSAAALTLSQRAGFYTDNESLDRRRLGVDLNVNLPFPALVNSSAIDGKYALGLSWIRDQDQLRKFLPESVGRDLDGQYQRTQDQWALTANQTWARLTETRQVFQGSDDGSVSSQTVGAGLSRWIVHETLRISLDASRTEAERPEVRILDFDSREVGEPAEGVSEGVALGLRHLATASTLVDYGVRRTTTRGRPETEIYSVRLRQYLVKGRQSHRQAGGTGLFDLDAGAKDALSSQSPEGAQGYQGGGGGLSAVKMSVELALTRAVNKGAIGLETTYGEVDGVTWETNAHAELPGILMARLGYRYYREEEVTRVLREEKLFGSDLLSLGVSYLFDKPSGLENRSLSGSLVVSRYQTNQGLIGRSLEVGFSALL